MKTKTPSPRGPSLGAFTNMGFQSFTDPQGVFKPGQSLAFGTVADIKTQFCIVLRTFLHIKAKIWTFTRWLETNRQTGARVSEVCLGP